MTTSYLYSGIPLPTSTITTEQETTSIYSRSSAPLPPQISIETTITIGDGLSTFIDAPPSTDTSGSSPRRAALGSTSAIAGVALGSLIASVLILTIFLYYVFLRKRCAQNCAPKRTPGPEDAEPNRRAGSMVEGTKSGSDDASLDAINAPDSLNTSNLRCTCSNDVLRIPSTGAALPPVVEPSRPVNPDDANPPTVFHSCNSPPVSCAETKPHGIVLSSAPHLPLGSPREVPQPPASPESISASTRSERIGGRNVGRRRVETDGGIRLGGGPPDEGIELEEELSETGTLPPRYQRY
ncbi:hypothetical protein C8Q74DRAFT_980935 [Fomes fomentarius]|nr:hypothetical protein C8Q74DRAFT_980935 [Fomes fomentarius]